MIRLGTAQKIRVITSAAVQLDCVGSWIENDDTTGCTTISPSTATTTDFIPVAASTFKLVKSMTFYNKDASTAQTVTVELRDTGGGGTSYQIIKVTLQAGQTLIYQDGMGWTINTAQTTTVSQTFSSSAPSSPANGDLWYETTNNIWWEYNTSSSKWFSAQVFSMTGTFHANAAATVIARLSTDQQKSAALYGLYVVDFCAALYVDVSASGNTASHYWNVLFNTENSAGTGSTQSTISTSAITVATFTQLKNAVGAVYQSGSTNVSLNINIAIGAGTPGKLYGSATVNYRWVR